MSKFEYISDFPQGLDRKTTLGKNSEHIEEFERVGAREIKDGHYTWVDSPLDESRYDGQTPFSQSFFRVLPKEYGGSMKKYVEDILKTKKGEAIGVEFGGPGNRMFSGFSPGFFKQTFGVSLVTELDGHRAIAKPKENHTVIQGDVLNPDAYEDLTAIIGERKADFIIERMGKGLEYIPHEPYYVSKILQMWYKLLNEGGTMFVQVPVSFNEVLVKWAKLFENYNGQIEFTYTTGSDDSSGMGSVSSFRLNKLPGAPEELPFLEPRELKHSSGDQDRNLSFTEMIDLIGNISPLAMAILSLRQKKDYNQAIDERINVLQEESEKLIDSPEANTPEIRARRRLVADNINDLLDIQQKLNSQFLGDLAAEDLIRSSKPEDVKEAEKMVGSIFKKIKRSKL